MKKLEEGKRERRMTVEEINKYVDMGDIENDEEITTERAIAELYRWIRVVEHESYEYENLTPKVLDMAIKALSAEKTAKWEFPQSRCAKCSYCGHIIYETIYRYCPNCGSKMLEIE